MIRYHARWVLPIASPPISGGTVVVDADRIAWVGPRRDAPAGSDRDLGDAILLPGLVNAHTHLELTAMRGFLEELPFHQWVTTLTLARRAVMNAERTLDAARLGIVEGLRAGITTYADTGNSDAAHAAMRERGVRGIAYREVFGPDPASCDTALAELRDRAATMRADDTALVRTGVSPHAPYSVSAPLFGAVAALARAESYPVAIHVAESAAEDAYVRDGAGPFAEMQRPRGFALTMRGASPVRALEATGALGVRPLLIHCVRVADEDIAAIARHDCGVAHCPASNAKLGHGVAPLLDLIERGVRVGLGSDSVASNNRMDILEEARLATLVQRARTGRLDALPAARALSLATLDGARALGLAAEIGTLEAGKQADLVAFPLDDPRVVPATDPVVTVVFALAGRPARLVTVAGRELVRDGVVLDVDARLPARVQSAADALADWRRTHSD